MNSSKVENEKLAYMFYRHLNLTYNLESLFFMNKNDVSIYDPLTGFKKEKTLTVVIAAGLNRDKRNMAVAADIVKEYLNKFGEIDSLLNVICYEFKFKYAFYEFVDDFDNVTGKQLSHDKLLINDRKLFASILSTLTDIGYKIDEALSQDFTNLEYIKMIGDKKQEEVYNAICYAVWTAAPLMAVALFNGDKYPKEPNRFDLITKEKILTRSEQVEAYINSFRQLGESNADIEWLINLLNVNGEEAFIDLCENENIQEILAYKKKLESESKDKEHSDNEEV